MRDDHGLSAAVYTELTDIEEETNGILTYDRLPKADLSEFAESIRGGTPPSAPKIVLPTSEQTPQTWKYTASKPDEQWKQLSFDDGAWQEGKGGFGKQDAFTGHTAWTTPDLWLRKHFNPGKLTSEEVMHVVQRVYIDGEYEVYINGVVAYRRKTATKTYENATISEEARRALKPDADNVVAVHCLKNGDRFLDIGLSVLVPVGK